eukprot:TRINITY_DN20870_c0_g2_i1.p1 TRINITY_DN20870_c0_g2~~TRINITY_DN20870_c0_g2_i1.p1  ORF type:complete len:1106 (-),score=180.65 TRINITY_DN20870_c0_g2_i1:45-3362(-)
MRRGSAEKGGVQFSNVVIGDIAKKAVVPVGSRARLSITSCLATKRPTVAGFQRTGITIHEQRPSVSLTEKPRESRVGWALSTNADLHLDVVSGGGTSKGNNMAKTAVSYVSKEPAEALRTDAAINESSSERGDDDDDDDNDEALLTFRAYGLARCANKIGTRVMCASRITSFFDRFGKMVPEVPPHWALAASGNHPLNTTVKLDKPGPSALSRRMQVVSARRTLEKDRQLTDKRVELLSDANGSSKVDQQKLRNRLLLIQPLQSLSDCTDHFTQILDDMDKHFIHNLKKGTSGSAGAKFKKATSRVMRLAKMKHHPFQTEEEEEEEASVLPSISRESIALVSTPAITSQQRTRMSTIFHTYTYRVAGPSRLDLMQRSTWFRFLHHCELLGTVGGISFSQGSAIFAIFSKGHDPPMLTLGSWFAAVQRVLRGPNFFSTQTEMLTHFFDVYLRRCEARLGGSSIPVITVNGLTIAEPSRVSFVSCTSSITCGGVPVADEVQVRRASGEGSAGVKGWLKDRAEEQLCEPEVLALMHGYAKPLLVLFRHFARRRPLEDVDVETLSEQYWSSSGGEDTEAEHRECDLHKDLDSEDRAHKRQHQCQEHEGASEVKMEDEEKETKGEPKPQPKLKSKDVELDEDEKEISEVELLERELLKGLEERALVHVNTVKEFHDDIEVEENRVDVERDVLTIEGSETSQRDHAEHVNADGEKLANEVKDMTEKRDGWLEGPLHETRKMEGTQEERKDADKDDRETRESKERLFSQVADEEEGAWGDGEAEIEEEDRIKLEKMQESVEIQEKDNEAKEQEERKIKVSIGKEERLNNTLDREKEQSREAPTEVVPQKSLSSSQAGVSGSKDAMQFTFGNSQELKLAMRTSKDAKVVDGCNSCVLHCSIQHNDVTAASPIADRIGLPSPFASKRPSTHGKSIRASVRSVNPPAVVADNYSPSQGSSSASCSFGRSPTSRRLRMSRENFEAMIHGLGFFPDIVQKHSLQQHLNFSLFRRGTTTLSFPAFVECLCRIAFSYLCVYGNTVQQTASSLCRGVWLVALLRARCRDHGARMGLGSSVAGDGNGESGRLWNQRQNVCVESIPVESLIFWRVIDECVNP